MKCILYFCIDWKKLVIQMKEHQGLLIFTDILWFKKKSYSLLSAWMCRIEENKVFIGLMHGYSEQKNI